VCERRPEDPPWVCQFSDYPGTVGWKSGFRALRDALKNDPQPDVPPEGDHPCDDPTNPGYDDGPGGNCERVFDRNRKDMFRFLLSTHALGVPKEDCLNLDESSPEFGLPDAVCQATDPLFHVPNTYTGIGDWGGGDFMLTMGGFSDAEGLPVGTDTQQAGTILHELGHTMMLSHGGSAENLNCSPNYLSVMNYLFQLRGLVDDAGELNVDFSGQTLDPLDESLLDESLGLGGSPFFRTSWYAPFRGVGSPVTLHCNGSPLLPTDMEMVRVDGSAVGGPIDWNADGTADSILFGEDAQDINFDGFLSTTEPDDRPLNGFNDWENLRLNQVGARRNIGVWFFADGFPYIGPASLDMGRFDFGRFDFGRFDFGRFDFGALNAGDLGRFDFGRFDFGDGDLNRGDLGRFDFGRFDFGRFDFGRFDFGVGAGDLGRGADGKGGFGRFDFGRFDFGGGADGELTAEIAVAAGLLGPPTNVTACVVGDPDDPGCDDGDTGNSELRVLLSWEAPDASGLSTYVVYRRADGEPDFAEVGTVERTDGVLATEFVDSTVNDATTYTYYVAARYAADGAENDSASDTVAVTVPDVSAPVVTLSFPAPDGSGGYFVTSPVEVTVSAEDASDVDSIECFDNGIATPVSDGVFSVSDEGTHDLSCTATDSAGNSGTGSGIVKIDTVAPEITITAPADGAEYVLDASVAADYECTESANGSGVATCSGDVPSGSDIDTSTVGTKTFAVTAADVAGNSTTTTATYQVIHPYTVTIQPLKNSAKLGSAVPVVWQVQDGSGSFINSLDTVVRIESVFNGPKPLSGCVSSAAGTRQTLFSFPEGATGGSSLRLIESSLSYKFNWDTSTAAATGKGCYTVLIYLDDQPEFPRLTTATQLK
jgi:hypothetical protein